MKEQSLEKKIKIHVTTGAKQQGVRKGEDRLEVKLTSQPIKGEANKELKKVLSLFFGVPQNYIEVVEGLRSKNKTINVKYYTGLKD